MPTKKHYANRRPGQRYNGGGSPVVLRTDKGWGPQNPQTGFCVNALGEPLRRGGGDFYLDSYDEPDGQDMYRAVNLSRMLQGLPWTDTPPVVTTMHEEDQLFLTEQPLEAPSDGPLKIHCYCTWNRGGGEVGPRHVLMVWGLPRQTDNRGPGQVHSYVWCGCADIEVGVPVLLDVILLKKWVVVRGGWVSLQLGVAEYGLAPFFRQRGLLHNVGL